MKKNPSLLEIGRGTSEVTKKGHSEELRPERVRGEPCEDLERLLENAVGRMAMAHLVTCE